ncbi:hypothetical protein AB0M64_21380 [Streptomyces sp. NPDC051771]|uniref:hypothetical protein n=1 Tax=Streptomyces sp. NPDC051771 TaxID=3154847 RepID=UPI00342EB672
MTSVVDALVKKAGDWWPVILVIAGLPFTVLSLLAWTLWTPWRGAWGRMFSLDGAEQRITAAWTAHTATPGATVMFLLLILAVAAGSSFTALGIGLAAQELWLSPWPAALRRWETRRIRRREALWRQARDEWEEATRQGRTAEAHLAGIRRNSICLAPPTRATWMGDRVVATATRLRLHYDGFDLEFGWHRVWLALDTDVRAELNSTRARIDGAGTLTGWSTLYIALAVLWPPALVIACILALLSWRRARANLDLLAHQMESAVDLTLRDLVERTGLPGPAGGHDLLTLFRKGA